MAAGNGAFEGLPRSSRIRKRREFLTAYRIGKKTFGRYVVVFAVSNDRKGARLGVTATRKLGNASLRNRRKRWTREIFRKHRTATGLDQLDVDLVVNLKRDAATTDFQAFRDDLIKTLKKAARAARHEREKTG